MAENAVQMVQRNPSPRGDKNGADINLALDALEMAFTHDHVNAFAIISGDSDFIPLVNKLKEYGKTVFVVGGKAFTSTILQQNCHEFISLESLLNVEHGPSHASSSAPPSGGLQVMEGERIALAGERIAEHDAASAGNAADDAATATNGVASAKSAASNRCRPRRAAKPERGAGRSIEARAAGPGAIDAPGGARAAGARTAQRAAAARDF